MRKTAAPKLPTIRRKSPGRTFTILGLDPGFASFGWALVEVSRAADGAPVALPFTCGVIRTAKATAKEHIFAAEDVVQRATQIYKALGQIMNHADVVSAESLSYPRSASVSAQMGVAWGVVASLVAERNLPLVQLGPQAAKKALTGLKSASKAEVQAAVELKLPAAAPMLEEILASKREHAADAFGLALCALDSESVRAMLRMLSTH